MLREFLGSIGDDGSAAEAERERNRVKRMLAALGYEEAEGAEAAPDRPASPLPPPPANDDAAVPAGDRGHHADTQPSADDARFATLERMQRVPDVANPAVACQISRAVSML